MNLDKKENIQVIFSPFFDERLGKNIPDFDDQKIYHFLTVKSAYPKKYSERKYTDKYIGSFTERIFLLIYSNPPGGTL